MKPVCLSACLPAGPHSNSRPLFSLSKVKASFPPNLRNVGNRFCPDASTFANVFPDPGPHPAHGAYIPIPRCPDPRSTDPRSRVPRIANTHKNNMSAVLAGVSLTACLLVLGLVAVIYSDRDSRRALDRLSFRLLVYALMAK